MTWLIDGMVYIGSALMIYNIIGFCRFARTVVRNGKWTQKNAILFIPIVLLIFFFLGYLGVAIFGRPDLLVSGILFGGSIFVFIMYQLLNRVTRRIYEQEHLRAELRSAEKNSQMKADILASMSHEMRTPMNVILGLSRILAQNKELPEESRDQVKKIIRSGDHLLQLINTVLYMNSLGQDMIIAKEEPFCLPVFIEEVIEIAEIFCGDKSLKFQSETGEAVEGWCLGDETMLKQALLSLLDNAAKYTDAPGSVTFKTECIGEEDGVKTIRFTVADTGVGIDEEFLPKIYEVFSREDASETSRFGGSGIGLAATKAKVDLMHGKIGVESEKNVGSTFTITVPLKITHAPDAEQNEEELASLKGRRILIVEDIPENVEILEDLLELEDVITEHAENGQIGVNQFEASPEGYYDAVLMDLRMPVLGGLEAAKKIRAMEREDAKRIPIIAVTANAFESDVKQTMEAGMNAHLAKPVDADQLYETLRKYIAQKEQTEKGNVQ